MAPSYTTSPAASRSGAPPLSITTSTSTPRDQTSYSSISKSSNSPYTPSSKSPYTPNTSKSPYPPQRSVSSPQFPSPSSPYPSKSPRRATEPQIASYREGSGRVEAKRRHTNERKTNVFTECGRHSDEWLFGGFSVAGVVRKMLEKKECE
jgi:hypothetical protein